MIEISNDKKKKETDRHPINLIQELMLFSADEGRTMIDESSSASANTVEEVTKETSNQEASDLASIDTESNGARFHQSVL